MTVPKEAKGGAIAPADIPLIKRALHTYLIDINRSTPDGQEHPDVSHVAKLLHRLGRIA